MSTHVEEIVSPSKPTSEAHETHETHFKPFISSQTILPEFTLRTMIVGAILGIIFGASSVYLALKVGLTVSASIPIAVLSITIFRALGRASILENNMVQTIGSAGESVAAGVVFTIPALLIMGYSLEISRVALIALTGGWLGVLLMVPLRKALIVKEHGNLTYPEGTACAEVLIVGEEGGSQAKTVFAGFGLGIVYKLLMSGLHLWKDTPERELKFFPGASVSAEVSPELMGVGYIIGLRVSGVMLAGGTLSYLVLMPAIKFFGKMLQQPLFPGTKLISEMSAGELRSAYILYIGAGAVATGGIISLARSLPMILSAFKSGLSGFTAAGNGIIAAVARTDRDISMKFVLGGALVLVVILSLLPQLQLTPLAALMILFFGFFFVTVSSRITGEIGSSSNPISGMTVATILLTCLIFLITGRTGTEWRVVALSVGAVVCIAASIGGATSQDLKTGFLVGATPRFQQMGLMIGVTTSALAVGWVLYFLNDTATIYYPQDNPGYVATTNFIGTQKLEDGKEYRIHSVAVETQGVLPGRYLVDDKGKICFSIDPGVGGRETHKLVPASGTIANATLEGDMRGLDNKTYKRVFVPSGASKLEYLVDEQGKAHYRLEARKDTYTAPKATLMSLIIDGILTQKLPWSLVLLGVFISITLELCGVAALPFAVGLYLPFSTSSPIFVGGLIRHLVDTIMARQGKAAANEAEAESGNGVLFSSGLIAGGAMGGLFIAALAALKYAEKINLAEKFPFLETGAYADIIAALVFLGMGVVLWIVGQQTEAKQE